MEEYTVREWVEKYNRKEFEKSDHKTQCKAGWYDWFCSTTVLAGRLKKMGSIIKNIKSDYILDNYRIWFKNNCPACDPLYDDFRLEPLDESRRNQLYIVVECGHPFGSEFQYEIATARNDYKVEFQCQTKEEVLDVLEKLAEEFQKGEQ